MERKQLEHIANFVCYYGPKRLAQLAAYDFAIVQAEHYTRAALASLPCQAVVGYLSLGEVPDTDAQPIWTLYDAATGTVARNPHWQTTVVDCRSEVWQDYLLNVRIPDLLRRGIHGFFLDTIDVQERFPETRPGVVRCLRRIRERYPELVLVVNRGFSILDTVAAIADAVVFEAFSTYHDGYRYTAWPVSDCEWTAWMATVLRDALGRRPILAIDYAAPMDATLRAYAETRARRHGLLSFVGTYALDWLP